jgi:peptidoglycan/xylan/chitin deacetylase (PgdA/CDA1 family)
MPGPTSKKLVVDLLDLTGIAWLASPFYRTRGIILGLHRVLPKTQTTLMPGNVMTTELLSDMLSFLKKSGFDFVPLDEIPERLRSRSRRRFAAITFDDGFVDNLKYALPLLSTFDAPFAVYPVTGLVDRTVTPWWVLLEELLLACDDVEFEHPKTGLLRVQCRTFSEKLQAYNRVRRWGYADPKQFVEILRTAYAIKNLSMCQVVDDLILSWDQTRTLHAHPLVTIGVHTVSHLPLTVLPGGEAQKEISVAHARLKVELRSDIRHIAYPYGQCGLREFRMAAEAGFKTGVTTHRGTVRADHSNKLVALPRIMLAMSPHGSSVRYLRVSIHGLWNTTANWWETRGG